MPNLMAVTTDVVFSRVVALRASVCVDVEPKKVKESAQSIVPDTLLHAEHVSIVAIDYFIDDSVS
jgi:hypothetical protein